MYLLTALDFSVSLCINATFNEEACVKQGLVQINQLAFLFLTPLTVKTFAKTSRKDLWNLEKNVTKMYLL